MASSTQTSDIQCAICLDTSKAEQFQAFQCSNHHAFHIQCLKTLREVRGQDTRCPLCRGRKRELVSEQVTHHATQTIPVSIIPFLYPGELIRIYDKSIDDVATALASFSMHQNLTPDSITTLATQLSRMLANL